MEEKGKGLVIKLGWANNQGITFPSDIPFIDRCKDLEKAGWGMLADKNNPDRFDEDNSVFSMVTPKNKIISTNDIGAYLERRKGNYSSTNEDDIDIHDAQVYYMGFIASHLH